MNPRILIRIFIWLIAWLLVAVMAKEAIDYGYYHLYFKKQVKEKQEQIMEWLNGKDSTGYEK